MYIYIYFFFYWNINVIALFFVVAATWLFSRRLQLAENLKSFQKRNFNGTVDFADLTRKQNRCTHRVSFLLVFSVPPDILDYPTSSDMVVHEGSNVTLQCAATGYPNPTITWRREDNHNIVISSAFTGENARFLSKFSIPNRFNGSIDFII